VSLQDYPEESNKWNLVCSKIFGK